MHALVVINQLRDAHVGDQRAERVGVLRGDAGFLLDQRDHVAQGDLRGIVEILIEAHGDPRLRRLRARRGQLHILAQMEFEGAGQRRLDRGEAHFAVALQGMAVAGGKQRAGNEHREISGAADAKFLVVHVAAEHPRLHGG